MVPVLTGPTPCVAFQLVELLALFRREYLAHAQHETEAVLLDFDSGLGGFVDLREEWPCSRHGVSSSAGHLRPVKYAPLRLPTHRE